ESGAKSQGADASHESSSGEPAPVKTWGVSRVAPLGPLSRSGHDFDAGRRGDHSTPGRSRTSRPDDRPAPPNPLETPGRRLPLTGPPCFGPPEAMARPDETRDDPSDPTVARDKKKDALTSVDDGTPRSTATPSVVNPGAG